MEIRLNVAETVKRLMRERQKTLSELSEDLDIPLSSMKNYVNGTSNLRADTIEVLADKFGMTPAELISRFPDGWRQADAVVRAAKVFSGLTPEQQTSGVDLFLQLVALFSAGGDGCEEGD